MSETSVNTSAVNTKYDELLSSLVDGEITELELRRLLKVSDEEFKSLRDRWSGYHMAKASINNDVPDVSFTDLSSSISALIAEEPAHSISGNIEQIAKPVKKQSVWAGVGRFAIAASVAGAVVLGVQFAPTDIDGQIADTQTAPVPTVTGLKVPSSFGHGLPVDTTISTVSTDNNPVVQQNRDVIVINEDTKNELKKAENEVNRLMLEHAQNSAQNTQQGVLPYARVPESSQDQ